jgi:hypothetical protein
MTPAEFKKKWARHSGKEMSAYQEHFNDLCALLERLLALNLERAPAGAATAGKPSKKRASRSKTEVEVIRAGLMSTISSGESTRPRSPD